MKTSYDERYRQIAKKIAYYRMKRGLSQDELADKIAISKSYLSKIFIIKDMSPTSFSRISICT